MPQKTAPKRRLKNLTVEFISLVDSGANQREVIYKNADAIHDGAQQITKRIEFRKADQEKRLVYGVVYAPDESDAHGDTMTAEDIEKAAHAFLATGQTNRVDKQHDENPDKGYIVESTILKGTHPEFPEDPEGTWIVAIKVTDEDTWSEIKKGDIKGISMQGYAEVQDLEEEVGKSDSILSAINEVKNTIRNVFAKNDQRTETNCEGCTFAEIMKAIEAGDDKLMEPIKKDFSEAIASEAVLRAVSALDRANWNAFHDEGVPDKKAALLTNAAQFTEYLSGLDEITKSTTNTEDEPMSDQPKETEVAKSEYAAKSPELKAIEKLNADFTEKFKGIESRLETVEKVAGGSQAAASQDEQPVEKSYNSKAPLSFGLGEN